MMTFLLRPSPRSAFIRLATIAGVLAVLLGTVYGVQLIIAARNAPASSAASSGDTPYEATLKQSTINDSKGNWLATFTWGARSVLMHGPTRTFSEPSSTNVNITTPYWVRVLPKPYDGTIDQGWVDKMTEQNNKQSTPDIIQMAMQYIAKAKPVKDDKGHIIAGDASFGPLLADGSREPGADFNDYIGIAQSYGSINVPAKPHMLGSLDNTGFLRMIWGYRSGIPMSLGESVTGIPRQAYQILEAAPGVLVADDDKQQITDFSRMQPGDIIFNDTDSSNDGHVDQAGMYLGTDSVGNHRFISSRQAADGPSFGDIGGSSVLDGNGLYARTFHAIRRF